MEEIEVRFYDSRTSSLNNETVTAYSLTEAIDKVRNMYNFSIFVYSVEYKRTVKDILNLK